MMVLLWIPLLLSSLLSAVHSFRSLPASSRGRVASSSANRLVSSLFGKKSRSKDTDTASKEAKRERRQRILEQSQQQMQAASPMNVLQVAEAYRGRDIPEEVRRGLSFLEAILLNDMSLFEATHPNDPFPPEFTDRFRRISAGGVWIDNVDSWVQYFSEIMENSKKHLRSRIYFDDTSRQHVCDVKASDLEEVTFKQLMVGEVNRGKVVYGTLTSHMFMKEGIVVLVEDKEKTVVPMYLYNLISPSISIHDVKNIFGNHLKIAIKEPFLKCMSDGYLGVQIDNPCNVEMPIDAYAITENSIKDPFQDQDEVEDYFGPLVIGDAGFKGRGVLLTRDVEEGELLFRERAFAAKLNDRPDCVAVNFKTNMYSDYSIISLVAKLVGESTRNSTVNNMLSVLSSERKSATFLPTLDMFRTRSFPTAPRISAYAIEGIITINAYSVSYASKRGTGLWIAASFFNHDAFPNTAQSIDGKVMTLTAKRALKAGTEVTVTYGSDSAILRRKWGI